MSLSVGSIESSWGQNIVGDASIVTLKIHAQPQQKTGPGTSHPEDKNGISLLFKTDVFIF